MVEDDREEVINRLCLYMESISNEKIGDIKTQLYLLLNDFEITSRSTELAEVRADRNEYLLKSFLIAKKVKGCTDRTLYFYSTSIARILEKIGKTVDDITAADIRYYMAVRRQRDHVTKITLGNEIRNLNSFFSWLHDEEMITKNPMRRIDRIKLEKTKKEALTEMEIEKLRMAARGEREEMIIEILLSTGCRVTELVNILITDIDGDRILVHGKGEKDRYVYLNARAMIRIGNYMQCRKDENKYLLPGGVSIAEMKKKGTNGADMIDFWKNPENLSKGHMSQNTVESMMRNLAQRAGVEKANPHKFRRTCATMALRRGMPIEQVSKMLGHENIETTQIYLDLTEDDLAMAHKKYVV